MAEGLNFFTNGGVIPTTNMTNINFLKQIIGL